ncbi:tRNA modification GTPase MSS1, mitochondrial [Cytospora mali]|uniref:tRNA modification GTPase MSS1, mitochondrial n=1 Tax=Cytospora mali TaxID=578113 RepID=A0A194VAK8_CYTMA|nr:tRNA modification GTPase MSS1, mitochondrial [Valsa mali var. pyri (nom. inval.)]
MFRHARVAVGTRRLPRSLKSSFSTACRLTTTSLWPASLTGRRCIHTGILGSSSPSQCENDHQSISFIAGHAKNGTIYALSSAQGRAGIAVIRISGPACLEIYQKLCPLKPLLKPRYASVRTLYDPDLPDETHILDSGSLVLFFPGPRTVTGEDVLELHTHGGPATVKAVLGAIPRCTTTTTPTTSALSRATTIRYAEPGEFTKRAFLNGRLDLSQVESLGDVLDAETEQQRRAAVRGNSGARGQTYDAWRGELLLARGEIEALIDFSEDQHFDESPRELLRNVTGMVRHILRSIDVHEMAGQRTELLRKGIRIALLGPPNVGKSSLMNLVVGREASIVSREAGTTRDVVEVSLDIGGYLCTFADTAGIRTQALANDGAIGSIEEEGIRRARLKALSSDVVVVLASIERDGDGESYINYDTEAFQLASKAEQRIVVVNKCDSIDKSTLDKLLKAFKSSVLDQIRGLTEPMLISCKEAETPFSSVDKDAGGIHHLTKSLVRSFENLTSLPEDLQELLGGTERQRQLLVQCRGHLEDFMREATGEEPETGELDYEPDIVLAAEHLRYAGDSLAKITGRGDAGDVEEVLGVIFEKFCVGK